MAAEVYNIRRYNYTGEDGEVPHDVTHVTVDESVTVIPARAFDEHPNIVEVVLHDKVKRIETEAFQRCRSLRLVIMPGVEVVERWAFNCCEALTDAKFGNKLESFGEWAFYYCESLERITIPLRDGMMTHVNIFYLCQNLKHVDLVEGELHETIAALQLGEWRNDMYEEIDSINQILPDTPARGLNYDNEGKAWAIQTWVRSVLRKIVHYIAEHRRSLNEERGG